MKNLFKKVALLMAMLVTISSFGNPNALPDEIILALKTGNSKTLAKYFDANIELKILEDEDIYSKTQAELILKDFFIKNKPVDFKILHDGGEGVKYAIGTITTSKGSYRVTVMYKVSDGQPLVKTLRIEEE
ncbi:MAG: hypothetical protein A2W91_04675 [Bacteroidetes bacterium GWF2_38_335]|nr:MAG: hypothetical protein A2W91_04675 [Bacteroidetes bacterium GWF2_38_335]OFY80036.1 MAG: hypothetical protein A2281_12180 [Bacteroidetes bacterium RIFOXYA12_FULL_38_20]HBS85226.1 DUF4783 domain-containing protein [Bacteroidales bacterium]